MALPIAAVVGDVSNQSDLATVIGGVTAGIGLALFRLSGLPGTDGDGVSAGLRRLDDAVLRRTPGQRKAPSGEFAKER